MEPEPSVPETNGAPLRKKFSKRRKEQLIDIEDEEGNTRVYKMREMDGTLRDRYMNDMNRRFRNVSSDGSVARIEDPTKIHVNLLNLCLLDDQNKAVPVDELQKWPTTALEELYDIAIIFNGLQPKKKEEEAAKNA